MSPAKRKRFRYQYIEFLLRNNLAIISFHLQLVKEWELLVSVTAVFTLSPVALLFLSYETLSVDRKKKKPQQLSILVSRTWPQMKTIYSKLVGLENVGSSLISNKKNRIQCEYICVSTIRNDPLGRIGVFSQKFIQILNLGVQYLLR